MTIQDYNCADINEQHRAGVAAWSGAEGITVTNSTITRRVELSGPQEGYGNGIWVKNDCETGEGGSHYFANNAIVGGFDGIGGEREGAPCGSFYRDTVIEGNAISECADDGIQLESGNLDNVVRDNSVDDCLIGVGFAANEQGTLTIEDNVLTTLRSACYKLGNEGSGVTYVSGNECYTDGDGFKQTNNGMGEVHSRGNILQVGRYAFEMSPSQGSTFDGDCIWSSDPERFIKWDADLYGSLADFQAVTGQELGGREAQDCPAS